MKIDVAVDGPQPGVKVFLNGVERKRVFVADEEGMFIVVADPDDQGQMQLNDARDAVRKEVIYGDVRIEVPHG